MHVDADTKAIYPLSFRLLLVILAVEYYSDGP